MRTNPAYAALAYRKAILDHAINYYLTNCTGANGVPPQSEIVCNDVFAEDRVLPQDVVMEFVEDLQREAQDIQTQMGQFQFRRDNDAERQPTGKKKGRRARKNQA